MSDTINLLQIKIDEARARLSKETRDSIDGINWKFIIQEMSKKYDPDQLENLEIETELLLAGILKPEAYQEELEKRLALTKEGVVLLLKDMDNLIFKKIQEKLIEKISGKKKASSANNPQVSGPSSINRITYNKPSPLDSRFAKMPNNIQEAIAKSDWKGKLYVLAQKYKISIEEMGILEGLTAKVISNEISPDKYEERIISEITISKENVSLLAKEVNDSIFSKIKESMQVQGEIAVKNEKTNEIPLPPYVKTETKKEEPPKPPILNQIPIQPKPYEPKPLTPIQSPEQPKSFVIPKSLENIPPKENIPATNAAPKNIIETKLQGATISTNTVSDHTVQKAHDPYHEPIE